MTETFADHSALATWSAPECPFTIEYSRKALDDIRLAVVDAFFSLPRGGAEIGGLLLGRLEDNRVQILDYAPLECEHAFGPAFTLSPADQTRLGDMLRQSYPGGLRPVGWYHSHTRSEISLCEADVDIHNRYFPERWQVALLLRPSTLQPTRAGFFFREPDGTIHAEASYQEFVVEPLPLQQVPAAEAEAARGPVRETEPEAVVIHLSEPEPARCVETEAQPEAPGTEARFEAVPELPPAASEEQEPVRAPLLLAPPPEQAEPERQESAPAAAHTEEPAPQPAEEPAGAVPLFHDIEDQQPRPQRPWLGIAAALAIGLVLGVAADRARSHPQPAPQTPVAASPATHHETAVPAQPNPEDASLRKQNDDLRKQISDLTAQNNNLRTENAHLNEQQADLAKQQAQRNKAQADLGKQQTELRQQRDDLAKQAAKLKADLSAQTARAQTLQQQVDDLRRQLQRRRLSIQSSDPLP